MSDSESTRRNVERSELSSGLRIKSGRQYALIIKKPHFCLRDLGKIAREIEAAEGLPAAKQFCRGLDYDRLAGLCERWHKDPAKEDKNNPNKHVHPRFMLLPWMDDALLPEDAREGLFKGDGAGPVLEMTRALKQMVPCEESAVFDAGVLRAYKQWYAGQAAAG